MWSTRPVLKELLVEMGESHETGANQALGGVGLAEALG